MEKSRLFFKGVVNPLELQKNPKTIPRSGHRNETSDEDGIDLGFARKDYKRICNENHDWII